MSGTRMIEFCRACREERDAIVPAEFILWGKLTPPEQLGPRCYVHTADYIGAMAMHQIQWAIFDLRPYMAVPVAGDLAAGLVGLGADAIRRRNVRAWTHSDATQYRLEARDVLAGALAALVEHFDDLSPEDCHPADTLRRLAGEIREVPSE